MSEKKENIFTKTKKFFKGAFKDMGESAKVQHEVDKANFKAAKAEAKANFEENRGTNTFKKAKENASFVKMMHFFVYKARKKCYYIDIINYALFHTKLNNTG